jgi:signal transduction histidine kinase
VTGRALRPVERIRREVEDISGSELDRRVPEPGTGDEIEALAVTMNRMLARIEQATEQQRRFTADASHELRSPLTSMATQIDVDLAHPETTDWPATAMSLRAETNRMQELVDDLLLLARTGDGGAPRSTGVVALDDLVFEAIARLDGDPEVSVSSDRVGRIDVAGDGGQLDRLLVNLVVNARRHAQQTVEIGATAAGGTAVLTVDDDGPGIDPAHRERVFERFVRLDEARARDTGGSGLGLALCAEITRLHGGSITIEDSHLGGARFVVALPTSPRT